MFVSVDKTNMDKSIKTLEFKWLDEKDAKPLFMTFYAQVDNGICKVYGKSMFQGLAVSLFQLDALLASDYNELWNRSVACSVIDNQINWPFYDEIVAAGEIKAFTLLPLSDEPSAAYVTSKALYRLK